MKEQKWSCEKCGKTGTIKYEQHADVMQVVHLIGDDHRSVSPACEQPVGFIKIIK